MCPGVTFPGFLYENSDQMQVALPKNASWAFFTRAKRVKGEGAAKDLYVLQFLSGPNIDPIEKRGRPP